MSCRLTCVEMVCQVKARWGLSLSNMVMVVTCMHDGLFEVVFFPEKEMLEWVRGMGNHHQ